MSLAYRAFINRELPIAERACTSKAAYLTQSEARGVESGELDMAVLAPMSGPPC
jgi:hypothetical protein